MAEVFDLLKLGDGYYDEFEVNGSTEQMFIEFNHLVTLHRQFEAYLSNSKLIYTLSNMKRSARLLKKRKLFIQWYLQKNQNEKRVNEITHELSEMLFCTQRTVENDIFTETTA